MAIPAIAVREPEAWSAGYNQGRIDEREELLLDAANSIRVSAKDIKDAIAALRGPMDRDEAIAIACAQVVLWALEAREGKT